ADDEPVLADDRAVVGVRDAARGGGGEERDRGGGARDGAARPHFDHRYSARRGRTPASTSRAITPPAAGRTAYQPLVPESPSSTASSNAVWWMRARSCRERSYRVKSAAAAPRAVTAWSRCPALTRSRIRRSFAWTFW